MRRGAARILPSGGRIDATADTTFDRDERTPAPRVIGSQTTSWEPLA